MNDEPFSQVLSRLRKKYGKERRDLVDDSMQLSRSMVAMIERGERGVQRRLTRQQVMHFANRIGTSPADMDALLAAAKLSTMRSEDEELGIQAHFDTLEELWIFARVIRDQDDKWFGVVAKNVIKKRVLHVYFTSDEVKFKRFHSRLLIRAKEEGLSEDAVNPFIECYLLPDEIFASNFALYNPGRPNSYCCGTVTEHGRGIQFYTSSEGDRLFQMLDRWRDSIMEHHAIVLQEARQIFPRTGHATQFVSRQ